MKVYDLMMRLAQYSPYAEAAVWLDELACVGSAIRIDEVDTLTDGVVVIVANGK